jgi:hypothetical protein
MDSTNYASGRITAYFENRGDAQNARDELLRAGIPSTGVVLQTLESEDESFLDALNRFFGSESERYEAGSILTLDDATHGTKALEIIQHFGGQIQVRHGKSSDYAGSTESATGTQSSGNP